jgi:hypothetical protein
MSKTKILAFSALWAMLSACGSQDGEPAKLKDSSQGQHISPFDTLVVEFNSKLVDIDKLTESENMVLSEKVKWVKPEDETSSNKLKFVGTNATPKGSPYFNANDPRGSIILKDLKNTDGYVAKQIEVRFSTMSIIGEIDYTNYEETTAKDLDPFYGNSTKTLEFAGILDHRIPDNKTNHEDYYKLKLQIRDTLEVKAKARDMSIFEIQIKELEKSMDSTFTPSSNEKFEFRYVIGIEYLDTSDPLKEYQFYIKVADNARPNDPPNPYTLTVSRLKYSN